MKVRQFLGFAVYRLTASWLPYWIPGSRRYRSLAAHLAVPTISPRSNINQIITCEYSIFIMLNNNNRIAQITEI